MLYHVAVLWEVLGMANAWGTIPASMCSASCKIWRRWLYNEGVSLWNGFGPITILQRNINLEGYKDILTRCILSKVKDQFSDEDSLYQHDNAPCHKARSVRDWFLDNKVPEMDWIAQNPDLNPKEHLWDELERRLHSRPQCPTSLTALATVMQEEWVAISPEMFRRLVVSLPGRVRVVIKAKGGPTLYYVHILIAL
jgi:hypothetical protein